MKKIKKRGSLNGFGIGVIIVLAVILFIRAWTIYPNEPFYMRFVAGAISCASVFFGAALLLLALMLAFYCASRINEMISIENEEENRNPLDDFMKVTDEFSIICFIVAYVAVFFGMKIV